MRTFQTAQELSDYAKDNLQLKVRGSRKLSKKLIKRIVQEEKKNRNRHLAIAKLIHLLSFEISWERELDVYDALASQMSQCNKDEDPVLIDFIILKGQVELLEGVYVPVVFAMCYLLRFKFGFMDDWEVENLKGWHQLLRDCNISHYFEAKVFHLHNLKVKASQQQVAA